jgi:predicted  nucleic acid-binding Zn-ribbon protein
VEGGRKTQFFDVEATLAAIEAKQAEQRATGHEPSAAKELRALRELIERQQADIKSLEAEIHAQRSEAVGRQRHLEEQLAALKKALPKPSEAKPWWRRFLG